MKKNIGNALALYPTPLVVIGAMVDGRPNWLITGHVGIIGHDRVMVSLAKPHYTNKGIKETWKLSINIVTEDFLPLADRAEALALPLRPVVALYWHLERGPCPDIRGLRKPLRAV